MALAGDDELARPPLVRDKDFLSSRQHCFRLIPWYFPRARSNLAIPQDGSIVSAADYGLGVAAGPNGSVFLAGYTKGFWGEQNAEDLDDFVVVMLDTGATATPSPAAESSLVGDALLPTPTPTVVRASGTPLSRATASLAPTITGPDAMHTPTPLWLFSVAPAQTASTSASFFSPMVIAIVGVTATLVCVCAGVFLRKKHQPNQNSNSKVDEGVPDNVSDPDGAAAKNNAAPSVCDRSEHSGTSDVVLAVLEAADNLAHHSQFPGVAEAATLVKTLVTLISNDHGRIAEAEARLKRCHLLVVMLERAATVLGKVRLSDCLHVGSSVPGLAGVNIATKKHCA